MYICIYIDKFKLLKIKNNNDNINLSIKNTKEGEMKMVKNTKGITLIALVITIIVLILLAGVSISLIMDNNGIATKAKQAGQNYQNAAIEEQTAINSIFSGLNGGSSTPTYTAYVIGQEVTVGGESFYVLENSDATQSSVTLLAKYNLNQAGTAQAPNAAYGDTAVRFSNKKYWASKHATYYDANDSGWNPSPKEGSSKWTKAYLDLNNEPIPTTGENAETVATNAILKARAYATAKGGTNGRLLTYEEADALKTSYGDMIWGTANTNGTDGNFLYYWLSSVSPYGGDSVWIAYGDGSDFDLGTFDYDDIIGVRPVIIVSKSLVS